MGYDFIEGSQPPLWRIWHEGREILISPPDSAMGTLLDSFMREVDNRDDAAQDVENASEAIRRARRSVLLDAAGLVAGVAVAVPSCEGVPLTFWLAGGTGWTCAGGIGLAAYTFFDGLGSVDDWRDAQSDLDDAQEDFDDASQDAADYFEGLAALESSQ